MVVLRGKASAMVKAEIDFVSNPIHPCCYNCASLTIDMRVTTDVKGDVISLTRKLTCTRFHISVNKEGLCNHHTEGKPLVLSDIKEKTK